MENPVARINPEESKAGKVALSPISAVRLSLRFTWRLSLTPPPGLCSGPPNPWNRRSSQPRIPFIHGFRKLEERAARAVYATTSELSNTWRVTSMPSAEITGNTSPRAEENHVEQIESFERGNNPCTNPVDVPACAGIGYLATWIIGLSPALLRSAVRHHSLTLGESSPEHLNTEGKNPRQESGLTAEIRLRGRANAGRSPGLIGPFFSHTGPFNSRGLPHSRKILGMETAAVFHKTEPVGGDSHAG